MCPARSSPHCSGSPPRTLVQSADHLYYKMINCSWMSVCSSSSLMLPGFEPTKAFPQPLNTTPTSLQGLQGPSCSVPCLLRDLSPLPLPLAHCALALLLLESAEFLPGTSEPLPCTCSSLRRSQGTAFSSKIILRKAFLNESSH